MTLQELRFVVALADTGHFGQAAAACYVSQSTLSTGLKKLEDHLGITLFDRSLKRVMPTPLGAEIVESARIILGEAGRIKELARCTGDAMDCTLPLGVIPTLGPYYLPHVLPLIRTKHPELRLLLREEITPDLLLHLVQGKLEAGLLALPVDDSLLEVVPLFVEPFVAAVPSGHPLASETSIALKKLAKEELLLLEDGHCLKQQALEACNLTNGNEEIRATSLETLRQMVGMGLGVTLLPALASTGQINNGQIALRPLASPGAARTIGLVWRKRSPLTKTLQTLAQTLKAALPSGVMAAN